MKPFSIIPLLWLSASLHAGTEVPDAKAPAAAPPVITAPEDDGWRFRVAPYGWLTAIDGDVSIGDLSAPVDISMGDTLDNLDLAAMGVIEVGYDRWSLGVDIVYGKVSENLGAGGRVFDSFYFEQKQWIITPALSYRVIETDDYHMDVFAGARFSIFDAELTGRFVRGGERSVSRDIDWVDPIVGIRGVAEMTEKLSLRYNADIGGFGANSDLTWQAFLGLGYRVNDTLGLVAGYRGLGVDYSDNGFSLDTVSHGPVIGCELRF
jgi:hypothetical protein